MRRVVYGLVSVLVLLADLGSKRWFEDLLASTGPLDNFPGLRFILVHNHPSGDPNPSEADIVMTQKIQLAAEALGLTVHDHLIIGKSAELSFRASHLL